MTAAGKGAPAQRLAGSRVVLRPDDPLFPQALRVIPRPPKALYVLGNPHALQEGLAVVGARKATPYGLGLARRFSRMAAERGVAIVSGGAYGCDAAAHEVAFLGGGCDRPYPARHAGLFERIAAAGGAVVSEHPWDAPPLPQQFRTRNRLIAGLARATLIVEAGLPSGTFSTADEALAANRDVLVVPGAITSPYSRGANRLLYQGATPIVDDESFSDALFSLFGCLKQETFAEGAAGAGAGCDVGAAGGAAPRGSGSFGPLEAALAAEPLGLEDLYSLACEHCGSQQPRAWLMQRLAAGEKAGLFARYPDGRWGPVA